MLISNFSFLILAYIFIVYVLCGVIKGSIGFGMPTVSISLLSFVIDIKIIIALILIPTLIVNMYQLSKGGNFKKILNETKYFLIFSTIFIFPGAYLLKILDSSLIIFFIALILMLRNKAKKNKDYNTSDQIRDKLEELNIEIKDEREGTTWKFKK